MSPQIPETLAEARRLLTVDEAHCLACGHALHMRRTGLWNREAEARRVAKAHIKDNPGHVVELASFDCMTGETSPVA
jgi:hypothetical protein